MVILFQENEQIACGYRLESTDFLHLMLFGLGVVVLVAFAVVL